MGWLTVGKAFIKPFTKTDIPTFPKPEPYIGRYVDGEIAGVKVSNPSYKKYYKDL